MEITIQEPWWSAWQKFGWAKGIWGIGLSVGDVKEAIKNKQPLIITIGGVPGKFKVSPTTVKNYAEKHNTKFVAKFNSKLYVIPQTELERYD